MNAKTTLLAGAAVAMLSTTGCMLPYATGTASVPPAAIISNGLVYPGENTSSTVYQLTTADFEIRGTVMAEGKATNIFFIIAEGDNGYRNLLQQAQALGADDVMNVRTDVEWTNYLGVYSEARVYLTGTAIKWK